MKRNRKIIMIISILLLASVTGIIIFNNGKNIFKGLEFYLLILITLIGVIAFIRVLKKDREIDKGLPVEDEMSNLIKYKSGYYAFMASMYMWLFIFLFKDKFPNIESMLGGGILLSSLIWYIAKMLVKREINEK
jgi:hypothetical protein